MSRFSKTIFAVLFCLFAAGTIRAQTSSAAPPALTLPGAVAAALAANPTTLAAGQQLAQAQARLGQAAAQGRFQITFNSTVSGSNAGVFQPPPSQETFGTIQNTLSVPLPLGNKPRLAITQANAQLAAAQAQYAAARLLLSGQVGAAYYDLLRKQALLQVAQDNQTQANRQLAEAQLRKQAGDVPELDVLRAQVPVASAEAALYGANNAVAVARQTLNSLIGGGLDNARTVVDIGQAQAQITLTLEQARALAVANSPDIRAAEATVRADQAVLGSARLSREPSVALQASDTRSNDQTSFSRLDTVQASGTVPLTDGGLARAQVREAEAALLQARLQANGARQTTLLAVSTAYLNAQSSSRQVAAAQVARDIAQTAYDKTVLGYQKKLFSFSDVLNAQSVLTQARIAYTQAVYDAATAVNTLSNAIGKETP